MSSSEKAKVSGYLQSNRNTLNVEGTLIYQELRPFFAAEHPFDDLHYFTEMATVSQQQIRKFHKSGSWVHNYSRLLIILYSVMVVPIQPISALRNLYSNKSIKMKNLYLFCMFIEVILKPKIPVKVSCSHDVLNGTIS